MVEKIFLTFLEISLGVSIIVVLLMLITPRTDRKYSSRWRYYLFVFITVRLLIPLNPAILNIGDILSLDSLSGSTFSFESQPLTLPSIDMSNIEVEETPLFEMLNNVEIKEKEKQYSNIDGITTKLPKLSMLQLVIYLWISGIIIYTIYTIIGYITYRKKIIRWCLLTSDVKLLEMVREISEDIGINKDIIIMEYSGKISPQMMGFLRNIMILPNKKLQEDELEFIIRHELAHVRNHHLWLKLLSTLTKTIHWFNPFVYYIANELEMEMEIQCDYEVIEKFNSERRRYYADMIIKLMDMEIFKFNGLTTCFEGGKRRMKKRLINIVGKRNMKRGIIPFIVVLLVTIIICGTIVFAKEDVKLLTEREARVVVHEMMENYNKESKLIQYENFRNEVTNPKIVIENLKLDSFTANMTYSNKWGTTTNIILDLKRDGRKWVIVDEKYGSGLIYVHADDTEEFEDEAGEQVIIHNMVKVFKGKIVEDSLIEKERERIAKICLKSKNASGRIFVFIGDVTDYNKGLLEVVNIKDTEKPKKLMNQKYSTNWDDIGNMIYSRYIFPKGKFTVEADGLFNVCIYHDDGSTDVVSAVKSNNKYEVVIEVEDSYYVSLHNRNEKYRGLSNTKYSVIPE